MATSFGGVPSFEQPVEGEKDVDCLTGRKITMVAEASPGIK